MHLRVREMKKRVRGKMTKTVKRRELASPVSKLVSRFKKATLSSRGRRSLMKRTGMRRHQREDPTCRVFRSRCQRRITSPTAYSWTQKSWTNYGLEKPGRFRT